MGFPNIDLWLVNQFVTQFQSAPLDLAVMIDDTFPDLDGETRARVLHWLSERAIVTDVRESQEGKTLTILPGFPVVDVPFPQITVVTAGEVGNDIPLGFGEGEAAAVYDDDDPETVVGWDRPKGYWSVNTYQIQVLCGHWWELVWLTRLCQRFILGMERVLSTQGVHIEAITVADLQLSREQFPTLAYARGISLTCRAFQKMTERLPASYYETGMNKALEA